MGFERVPPPHGWRLQWRSGGGRRSVIPAPSPRWVHGRVVYLYSAKSLGSFLGMALFVSVTYSGSPSLNGGTGLALDQGCQIRAACGGNIEGAGRPSCGPRPGWGPSATLWEGHAWICLGAVTAERLTIRLYDVEQTVLYAWEMVGTFL